MKINELVTMMQDSKVMALKQPQLKAKLKKDLEVVDYMSIKDKKDLIESIVNDSVFYEDGVYKINGIIKYVTFTMRVIEAYTNLELSDDIDEDYDILCKAGLIETIVDTFNDEYQSVLAFMQMRCDYILASNTIEAKVGSFLDGILEKVNSLSDVLEEQAKNFDISKLNVDQKDISKLMSFLNIVK